MSKAGKKLVKIVAIKLLNSLWQYPLGLSLLLLICILMGTFLPIMFFILWVFIIGASIFAPYKDSEHSRPALFLLAIFSIFIFLGVVAPFRAVCLYIIQFFPEFTKIANFWIAWIQDYTDIQYIAYMDFVLGLVTSAIVFIIFTQDIMWRFVQLRQIKTLPKSTARAAAQGMVKIEGIVEPLRKSDGPLIINAYKTSEGESTSTHVVKKPFYVRDKTGKVLVDPKNAEVIGGEISFESKNTSLLDLRACEIILSHPAPKSENYLSAYQLLAGDKVTLYGTAKANRHFRSNDLGNEAEIIIKASKPKLSKFKFHDVFLLAAGHGADPVKALRRRTKSTFISMLMLLGACLLLAMIGYHGIYDFETYYHPELLVDLYKNID